MAVRAVAVRAAASQQEMEQQARSSVDAVKFSDPQWSHTISQLVTSYLAHKGYHETATILARETNTTVDSPIDTIKARRGELFRRGGVPACRFPSLRVISRQHGNRKD